MTLQVIQSHRFTRYLKVMQLPISDLEQSRPYLAPFSHNLSVTNEQTDGRQWWQRVDLSGRPKNVTEHVKTSSIIKPIIGRLTSAYLYSISPLLSATSDRDSSQTNLEEWEKIFVGIFEIVPFLNQRRHEHLDVFLTAHKQTDATDSEAHLMFPNAHD